MPVSITLLETIIELYKKESGSEKPADYFIITRISGDRWQAHKDSRYTREDSKGFKYDFFHAEHPENPKTSTNPLNINLLSSSFASQGYEVYAFAYREEKYKPIAASGATAPVTPK